MKDTANNGQQSSKPLQPLAAELVLRETVILKEPRLVGNWVLWLEQRPNEGGRTTAVIRPWGQTELTAQELTPAPINIRARVHSYGGGALATLFDGDKLLLAWIDDCDGCLWFQAWRGISTPQLDKSICFNPLRPPIRLSFPSDFALADGLIDSCRNRWIGVLERGGRDFLVSFSLSKEDQLPTVFYEPKDFVGYIALSSDGLQLAWVEWQQPTMPWDSSQLWWGCFNDLGDIKERQLLVGSISETSISISVFQPIWLPSGELLVTEDSTGWWNLMMTGPKFDSKAVFSWQRLWPMEGETAMPQWVYGMSTSAIAGEIIVTAQCTNGSWCLNRLSKSGQISKFKQPFDDLSGLNAQQDRVVAIASNCLTEPGLLEIDLTGGIWRHSTIREPVLNEDQISQPESFWFEGFGGDLTHSWYYPPLNWDGVAAPLLVKSHSGPTGMASRGLNLAIQFWTSRGWGVVDVNYGGSTGFGRAYRERLKGGWGEVDVFDCVAAAKSLVAEGKANSDFLAIEGGSAGGFTTLACLCFTDVFRVAACRYAVSDLIAMDKETHRFESGYLDHLLGSLPRDRLRFLERSPLEHAEKINCPVIFFQGMKDEVVLPSQTEKIAFALRKKNIPVEVHTFANEGHGFRDGKVKLKVLESTERFFSKHLGI